MQEIWRTFAPKNQESVLLVLDTSDSAASTREAIIQEANSFLAALPKTVDIRLAFLGTSQDQSWKHNDKITHRAFPDRYAPSLITPIFTQFKSQFDLITVIGTGRIFDLSDWMDDAHKDLIDRTIFIALGEMLTNGERPEFRSFSSKLLPSRWSDDPITVAIETGAMPFSWSNDSYQWQNSRLICSGASNWQVNIGFLHPELTPVHADITYRSGTRRKVALQPCPPDLPPLVWQEMPEIEAEIFYSCIHEQRYLCPHCHQHHPAHQVWPPCVSPPLSRPLYSSLKEKRGLVLLKDNGFCVRHSPYGQAGLRVENGKIALTQRENYELYEFTAEKGWKTTGRNLEQYLKIAEDLYAIVL